MRQASVCNLPSVCLPSNELNMLIEKGWMLGAKNIPRSWICNQLGYARREDRVAMPSHGCQWRRPLGVTLKWRSSYDKWGTRVAWGCTSSGDRGKAGGLEPKAMEWASVEVKGITIWIVRLVLNHTGTVVWRLLCGRFLICNYIYFDGRIAYPRFLDGKSKNGLLLSEKKVEEVRFGVGE